MTINDKLAYSPQEAAMTLGLCLNTIYKLLKRGQLQSVKLDRKILIPRTEIDRLLRPDIRVTNTGDKTQRNWGYGRGNKYVEVPKSEFDVNLAIFNAGHPVAE